MDFLSIVQQGEGGENEGRATQRLSPGTRSFRRETGGTGEMYQWKAFRCRSSEARCRGIGAPTCCQEASHGGKAAASREEMRGLPCRVPQGARGRGAAGVSRVGEGLKRRCLPVFNRVTRAVRWPRSRSPGGTAGWKGCRVKGETLCGKARSHSANRASGRRQPPAAKAALRAGEVGFAADRKPGRRGVFKVGGTLPLRGPPVFDVVARGPVRTSGSMRGCAAMRRR